MLTIFLALGAWRISKSHVLTRQVPVVEMLGSARCSLCRQDRHADPEPDVGREDIRSR